jgi:hypothetical protein
MGVKLTKQGVRDLGGARPPRRRLVYTCPHIWEREVEWSCWSGWDEQFRAIYRCGLCQEIRR